MNMQDDGTAAMTPAGDPAAALAQESAVAARLLDDGELVLLAIRPSAWFVVLVSGPVLAVAVVLGLGAYLADKGFGPSAPYRSVLYFCAAAFCARLVLAAFQWVGRLYVLTNRRVLWISGVLRVAVSQCPLPKVRATRLSATLGERLVGIGSLVFELRGGQEPPDAWITIARPKEVQEQVESAIRRAGS